MEELHSDAQLRVMKESHRIGLIAILSFVIYGASMRYGFIAIDDGGQVLENPFVGSFSWENIRGMFTSETVGMYQPLTTLLFTCINVIFGHAAATPFHVVSLLLHTLNGVLMYQVGKRFFQQPQLALLLSLLFVTHPLAVEAVCWVSATSTLLFTACFLAGMLAYDRFLTAGQRKSYLTAVMWFALGCLAKVQMLPFVGVLFLLDYWRGGALIETKRLAEKLPFLGLAIGFGMISWHFRGGESGFSGDYNPVLLVPSQILWYLTKTFAPFKLGIVYDWPDEAWNAWNVAAIGVLAGLGVLLYRFRNHKLVVIGTLFFLGNIVLHTTLVTSFLGPYADRYAYLSSVGIWLAVFGLLDGLKPAKLKPSHVNAVGIAAVLVFTGLALQQTRHWQNTIALWTQNLEHQKATFSNGMRGALYYEAGKFAQAKRDFEKVDAHPDLRFEPQKFSYLYTALGLMTTDSEPQNSLRYFKQAAEWKPEPAAFENVAIAAKKLRDFETAERYYQKVPRDFKPPSHYLNLSSLYFESQQFDKGAAIMTEAIDAGCNDILCYKMRCYFRIESGDFSGANEDFEQASAILTQLPEAMPDPDLENMGMRLLLRR